MRSMRLCTILCVVALLIVLAVGVSACQKDTPPALEVHLEGEAYRGAELTLSAEIAASLGKELQEAGQKVSFDIVEGADWCYLYQDKIKILNVAPVGTVISVQVTALEHTQTVSCTVGHTPVTSLRVEAVPTLAAGAEYTLSAVVTPAYADDNAVGYVLTKGSAVADIRDGVLHVLDTADASDEIEVTATAGGVQSAPVSVRVGTVQATDLSVSLTDADSHPMSTTLHRKDRVLLNVGVTPATATVPVTIRKDRTAYADQYVGLEDTSLSIAEDAPEGTFDVVVGAGRVEKTLSFTVAKTPVEMVVLSRNIEGYTVAYNDVIGTQCRVYPAEATYRNVTYTVEDGAQYVEAQSTPGYYRVTTRLVDAHITIRATADGKYSELRLTTVGVQPQSVRIETDGNTSVQVGDTRTLTSVVSPAECQATVLYTVEEGRHLCSLEDNVLTFTQMEHGNDPVVVRASVGNVSSTITFHVVPVPVSSVVISTTDATTALVSGDTVTFVGVVQPANASYPALTYRIASGGALGTIEGNRFTVGHNTAFGSVFVEAVSEDGVVSNRVELKINADAYSPTFATWADLDAKPHLLDNNSAVYLDLRTLPYDAGECVVVVSDDVEVLTLRGNYRGTLDTCYKNLYFYFLTTDSVSVYLNGMGIVIDNGFTDTVLDFGAGTATLVVENDNYVAAGHAYALSTVGFMIEGEMSDSRLMNGMDGFAGQDGGTAVSGYAITVAGAGNLTLVGGDASSGTDATDGLSTTLDATYAGNGGWGGNGGEGGYAIYAHSLTYDLSGSLTLVAGASGTAGNGGAGGTAPLAAYCGVDGRDGTAGAAHDAVHADTLVNHAGTVDTHTGSVRARTVTRTFATVDTAVALLCNHFKVNIYYATGWKADHTIDYSMSKLNASTDVGEILRLLHGMEYALQTFGPKAMIEFGYHKEGATKVNFYLCKTIRTTGLSPSDIYGLTDSGNCVWYSAFTTRKRDSFYSTYYNIMVHEIFHLFYFQASSSAQSGMSAATLSSFNGGVKYYARGYGGTNDTTGVYDGTAANAKRAYFLTKYSKLDNREDISETLSILAVQPQVRSFMESDSYIYTKANYLSQLLGAEYACIDAWKPYRWLRYAR